jgi:hypothetical protein
VEEEDEPGKVRPGAGLDSGGETPPKPAGVMVAGKAAERAANRDESRQIKVNQLSQGQAPVPEFEEKTGGGGVGAMVQFLHEERLPYEDEPGFEILHTRDDKYGVRYRKVPMGWQDPEGISPAKEAEALPAIDGNPQTGMSGLLLPSVPYVPDPDPEVEAYNRWWRMNRNFERFDYDELQRIYAELPQKIAEYQAQLPREAAVDELAAECMEGIQQ